MSYIYLSLSYVIPKIYTLHMYLRYFIECWLLPCHFGLLILFYECLLLIFFLFSPIRPMLLSLLLNMIYFIYINSQFMYLHFLSLFLPLLCPVCFLPKPSRQYTTQQWNCAHYYFSLLIIIWKENLYLGETTHFILRSHK